MKDDNKLIEIKRKVMGKIQTDVVSSLKYQLSANDIKTILEALLSEIEINGRVLPVISLYIVEKESQAEKQLLESIGDQHPRSIEDIETVMKRITLTNFISDDMESDVENRCRAVFQRNPTHLITLTEADKYINHFENKHREFTVGEMAATLIGILDVSNSNLLESITMDSEKLKFWVKDLFQICENKVYIQACRGKYENAGKGNSKNITVILRHMMKERVLSSSEAQALGIYFMRYHNDASPPGLLKSLFRHVENSISWFQALVPH